MVQRPEFQIDAMIVGSYQLHLYCDFNDDSYEHRGSAQHPGPGFQEISEEETLTRAIRRARRYGWQFSRGGCLCPFCVKMGRKLSPQNTTVEARRDAVASDGCSQSSE